MKRILVVDDEPAIGRLVTKVAEECGYDVTAATNAETFMDELVTAEPYAVVLDLSMPGTDGVELLRFMAASKCRSKILIMSGFDQRVLETSADLGATLGLSIAGTITKPVRVADLRSRIKALEQEPVS